MSTVVCLYSPPRAVNSPAEDVVGQRGVPEAATDGDAEGPGPDPGGARGSAALTSACTTARRASTKAESAAAGTATGGGRRGRHRRCHRRWISHPAPNRRESLRSLLRPRETLLAAAQVGLVS